MSNERPQPRQAEDAARQERLTPAEQSERPQLTEAHIDTAVGNIRSRADQMGEGVTQPLADALQEGAQAGVVTPEDQVAAQSIVSEAQRAKQQLYDRLNAAKQRLEAAKQAWKDLGFIGRLRSTEEKMEAQMNLQEAQEAYDQAIAEVPDSANGNEALEAHQAGIAHEQAQDRAEQYSSGWRNLFSKQDKWQAIVDEGEAEDRKIKEQMDLNTPGPAENTEANAPEQGAAEQPESNEQTEQQLNIDQLRQDAARAYEGASRPPEFQVPEERDAEGNVIVRDSLASVLDGSFPVTKELKEAGWKPQSLNALFKERLQKKMPLKVAFYMDRKKAQSMDRMAGSLSKAQNKLRELDGYIMENRVNRFSPAIDAMLVATIQQEQQIAAEIKDIMTNLESHLQTRDDAKTLAEVTLPSLVAETHDLAVKKQEILNLIRKMPTAAEASGIPVPEPEEDASDQGQAEGQADTVISEADEEAVTQELDDDDRAARIAAAKAASPFRAADKKRKEGAAPTPVKSAEASSKQTAREQAPARVTKETEASPAERSRTTTELPEAHWTEKQVRAAQSDRRQLRQELGLSPDDPKPTGIGTEAYKQFSNKIFDAEQNRLAAEGLTGAELDAALYKFEEILINKEESLRIVEEFLLEKGAPLVVDEEIGGPEEKSEYNKAQELFDQSEHFSMFVEQRALQHLKDNDATYLESRFGANPQLDADGYLTATDGRKIKPSQNMSEGWDKFLTDSYAEYTARPQAVEGIVEDGDIDTLDAPPGLEDVTPVVEDAVEAEQETLDVDGILRDGLPDSPDAPPGLEDDLPENEEKVEAEPFQADVQAILGHLQSLNQKLESINVNSSQLATNINAEFSGMLAFARVIDSVSPAEHETLKGQVATVRGKMQEAARQMQGSKYDDIKESVTSWLDQKGPRILEQIMALPVVEK